MLRSSVRRVRSLCAVVATLLLCAQVSIALHALFVHHSVCAEHGELVHGTAAGATNSHAIPGQISAAPAEPPAEDEHGHCVLSRRASDGALLEPPTAELRALAQEQSSVGVHKAHARAPRLILLLAPKQSPPA